MGQQVNAYRSLNFGNDAWQGPVGGAAMPNIHTTGTTQLFPIGTRVAKDERVWRYGKAATALVGGRAVANAGDGVETAVAAATSATGAFTVTITVQAAVSISKDEFAGGYLTYKNSRYYTHRIKSNTAAVNAATSVITLETPLYGAGVTVSSTVLNVYHSPWGKLANGNTYPRGASFVGVTGQNVSSGSYCFVQTWGPCAVVPVDFYGATSNERALHFNFDGAIDATIPYTAAASFQWAGFLLPCTYWNSTLNDLADGGHLVYLQIAP